MNEICQFLDRYFDFWKYFNPGRQIPCDLAKTARRYAEDLIAANVSYADFDRICSDYEREQQSLPYSFSLPAYILDMLRCEREDTAMRQQGEERYPDIPIRLPINGVPIDLEKSPHLRETVEKLKHARLPNWLSLMERINARRLGIEKQNTSCKIREYKCYACQDSGQISCYAYSDEAGHKRYKLREIGDSGGYEFSKRCLCHAGIRLGENWRIATPDECAQSAQMNGGQPVIVDAGEEAPF